MVPLKKKPRKDPPATPALSGILDNRENGKVGDFLREKITPDAEVRVVSAYFSIYVHQALCEELNKAGPFRFLFGDPRSVGNVDPAPAVKQFLIQDGELGSPKNNPLRQKYVAQQCEKWVDSGKVHIQTMADKNDFLHGKMFHILPQDGSPSAAVCGSSNFTARGLGFGRGNRELNIVADPDTADDLRRWFDNLWRSRTLLRNAKGEVLEALKQLGKNQDPEFIYFLTLHSIFHEELDKIANEREELGLEESEIWRRLYPFQKDAVYGVIRRLKKWGGCILADSVGLGKTYTALAVIRYFQHQRILVLCPKRLMENWRRFIYDEGNNPLKEDGFDYRLKAHTDLGRENDTTDWSVYDLVVIDESHNFRNHTGSRYEKLRDALKQGAKTKVLMLSATPVNTSLKDIRNQIHLMAEDNDFRRELGIASVSEAIRLSQAGFAQWEKSGGHDKDALMERLGGAFLTLMDAVSIARNRRHVKNNYADSFAENGAPGTMADFPKCRKPEECKPKTDRDDELSYKDLHGKIKKFGLSIYTPSFYLRPDSELHAQMENEGRFKQTHREKFLIGLMQVNFLKRLESSAHSFCQTLERTIGKIEAVEKKIARIGGGGGETAPLIAAETAPDPDEYGEDDDFMVGKGRQYDLRQMRLDDWSEALAKDRKELKGILKLAEKVTPERDAKLAKLKEILREKAQNPPKDKDGKPNRKALVFTSFSDTAAYLYGELRDFARNELEMHIALVVGSGANRTTAPVGGRKIFAEEDHPAKHSDILKHFAPHAQEADLASVAGAEIDLLIATDCVSEGQNLQDCDMVVNYDIHWNPVRIIQRFGRVDRIGGRNKEVRRVDFWPHMELNEYLRLQERVQARMALAGAVAAGDTEVNELKNEATSEVHFRDEQLKRLREEALTLDDLGGVSASDFTMADFLMELRRFLETRREELENAPPGLFAVVESNPEIKAKPGIIFCLRKTGETDPEQRGHVNPTHPYFLIYVLRGENGPEIRFAFPSAKTILRIFGNLCRGKSSPDLNLCGAFDAEIDNGKNMESTNAALRSAIDDIVKKFIQLTGPTVGPDGDGMLPQEGQIPQAADDFELISWLVIRDHPL